jgi:pimeloyl-ACP methyl ester carboxylesterase
MRLSLCLRTLVVVLISAASWTSAPLASVQTLDLKPCTGGRGGARAECGQLLVPENRATGQGRRIPINVVVLRAEQAGAKTALFLLAGGPGQGSTSMAGTANGWMGPLRASMDMVLMDQRGTGGSNALPCETEIAANPAAAFGHVRDPDVIKKCLAALGSRADLTQYTTDIAVEDMEELRVKLGYDSIALYGGSYGTRIAQAYLRRHPDRTRAVVIDGVLPFDVGGAAQLRTQPGRLDRSHARELPGHTGLQAGESEFVDRPGGDSQAPGPGARQSLCSAGDGARRDGDDDARGFPVCHPRHAVQRRRGQRAAADDYASRGYG